MRHMTKLRSLVVTCFGGPAALWLWIGLATGTNIPFFIAGGTIASGAFLLWLMRPLKPGDE